MKTSADVKLKESESYILQRIESYNLQLSPLTSYRTEINLQNQNVSLARLRRKCRGRVSLNPSLQGRLQRFPDIPLDVVGVRQPDHPLPPAVLDDEGLVGEGDLLLPSW